MEITRKCWKVRDKGQLLLAMMQEFEGNAHVSFEGDLRALPLSRYPGASFQPTVVLKRNTIWPEQDFVVVPLETSSSKKIYASIGGAVPRRVLHIQIEKGGALEFGAYDNFHPECIFFGDGVKRELIEALVSSGILQPVRRTGPKQRWMPE